MNYQEVKKAIEQRQNFRGNYCQGTRDHTAYRIKSNDTVIYTEANITFIGIFDTSYYSDTTSKIQGIIAKVIYNKSLQELRKEPKKINKVINTFLKCLANTLHFKRLGIELTS